MSKNFRVMLAASAGLAALLAAAAANADCGGCRPYVPQGLLEYLFPPSANCSPCAAPVAQPVAQPVVEAPVAAPCSPCRSYQGDYMVQQRASYSGPAVIAPQPTYAPSPTAAGYPYVSAQNGAEAYPEQGDYQPAPVAEPVAPRRHIVRRAVTRRTVKVHGDLPATKGAQKGVQVIHARAEVKIYGSKRMDIHLYRN